MVKYAVLFSYVGRNFCGWQKQKGTAAEGNPSIQATIEEALHTITQEYPSVVGSGRTDSGVHAAGQPAHFILRDKPWEPYKLYRGLNSVLPDSIRALSVQEVPLDFHAQRSADKKQYSYYYQQGPAAMPHLEPVSMWIYKRLDLAAMQKGLDYLLGEHDFKPFQASGSKPGMTTTRTILEAQVGFERAVFPAITDPAIGSVRIRIVGTGFLKQMVRGIAGTLLQVGENRRDPACFKEILETMDRNLVGPTAPARGLWLERVWYPDRFKVDFPHPIR